MFVEAVSYQAGRLGHPSYEHWAELDEASLTGHAPGTSTDGPRAGKDGEADMICHRSGAVPGLKTCMRPSGADGRFHAGEVRRKEGDGVEVFSSVRLVVPGGGTGSVDTGVRTPG